MKLADYKKLLKGHELAISNVAGDALSMDWRIGALGALNQALYRCGFTHPTTKCLNENTANAVLGWVDRRAGK